jgi:hypothetical protein
MKMFTITEVLRNREAIDRIEFWISALSPLLARFTVNAAREIEIYELDWECPPGDREADYLVAYLVDVIGYAKGVPIDNPPEGFPAGEGQLWVMGDKFLMTYNEHEGEEREGFITLFDERDLSSMKEESDASIQRWLEGIEEAERKGQRPAQESWQPSAWQPSFPRRAVAEAPRTSDEYIEVEE